MTHKYDLGFLAKLHALTCLWRVDPFLHFGLLFQFSWLKQPYWNKNYVNTFLLNVWKLKPDRNVGNYTIKVLKLIRTFIDWFFSISRSLGMERVRCYGPASDMGVASKGHFVSVSQWQVYRAGLPWRRSGRVMVYWMSRDTTGMSGELCKNKMVVYSRERAMENLFWALKGFEDD